jgi:iron complex transport system substrate-binding protein
MPDRRKTMTFASIRAALAALALSASPALAAEIDTAAGPVTIDGVPETIAVFDIAAIDTISALGVSIEGVPDNLYLAELRPLADEAEVVGTLFEPDLEALNALGPDLVVIGGRSSTQGEQTRRVAPTIDMTMDGDDLVEQAKSRIAAYGTLFDRAAEAERLAAELDAKIDAARQAVSGKGDALIVMTNGPKISVYGEGSRFGWVHRTLGLPAAAGSVDASTHGDAVSFEFIRETDPDWLIVLDRAAAIGSEDQNARATLDNELVAATKAWRNDRVIYMPAADFYIAAGGFGATGRVLDRIAEAFDAAQ